MPIPHTRSSQVLGRIIRSEPNCCCDALIRAKDMFCYLPLACSSICKPLAADMWQDASVTDGNLVFSLPAGLAERPCCPGREIYLVDQCNCATRSMVKSDISPRYTHGRIPMRPQRLVNRDKCPGNRDPKRAAPESSLGYFADRVFILPFSFAPLIFRVLSFQVTL